MIFIASDSLAFFTYFSIQTSLMSSSVRKTRLKEKELAVLYKHTPVVLAFDKLVDKQDVSQDDLITLNQDLSALSPDDAVVALSLCSLILCDVLQEVDPTLITELRYYGIDNVESFGRFIIDIHYYDVKHKDEDLLICLQQAPEKLQIIVSLLDEIMGEVEKPIHSDLIKTLLYQAEAQADLASGFLDYIETMEEPESCEEKKQVVNASRDVVPLPKELQQDVDTGKVVAFNMFLKQN